MFVIDTMLVRLRYGEIYIADPSAASFNYGDGILSVVLNMQILNNKDFASAHGAFLPVINVNPKGGKTKKSADKNRRTLKTG